MTMFKGVNRVVFDLDNTLFKHDAELEFKIICEKLRIPYNNIIVMQIDNFFANNEEYLKGKKVTKSYMGYVAEELMPVLRINQISGIEFIESLKAIDTISLMDGARDVLNYLQEKGYMIIALSNWFLDHQCGVMHRLGIHDYFDRIYTWDNHYAKPDRRCLQRVLDGSNENQYVLVGDNLKNDIVFASENNISSVWYNFERKSNYTNTIPNAEITSLSQLKLLF